MGGGYSGSSRGGGGSNFSGAFWGSFLGTRMARGIGGGGNYGGGPQPPQQPGGAPGGQQGNAKGCAIAIILFVLLLIVLFAFSMFGGCSTVSITPSTVERQPLAAGNVVETPYFTDDDGAWIYNPSQLEAGMRQFFSDTGVQPYLYILPNGTSRSPSELAKMASDLYDELFQDEGHFLVVFCDDNYGSYNVGYQIGSQAKTVMDNEAIQIFNDYLDRYYFDYNLSEEQIFSRTFESTGEAIMFITPSPVVPISIAIAVVTVVVLVIFFIIYRRNQKEREQKRMQEILNTPLEKFGDKDLEDLEKKYEE